MVRERKFLINGEAREDISLFGSVSEGSRVLIELHALRTDVISSPVMHIHTDGLEAGEERWTAIPLEWSEISGEEDVYRVEIDMGELAEKLRIPSTGLLYYEYRMTASGMETVYGGEDVETLRTGAGTPQRQLLIYKKRKFPAPPDGIIYHIFVDRFRRSGACRVKSGARLNDDWENGIPEFAEYPGAELKNNLFFGGDLYGIAEKLPYIASLGASVIYLSPIFDSPSNHKYDTGNYMEVDSMFGGNDAFRLLLREAERLGVSIMLDGVFNHTGDDSLYFNRYGNYDSVGAFQSCDSPYYPWYSFIKYPDEYECWWGIKIMPRVRSDNESFRRYICDGVVRRWMDEGVRSWRLDVIDELSDAFLDDFRKTVDDVGGANGMVIGEVWEDASDKVSYGRRRRYFADGQIDSVMNYPLRNAVISYVRYGDDVSLRRATEGLYRRYPKECSDRLMNFLGTHDTERALTVLGDDSYGDLSNAELAHRTLSDEQRRVASGKLCEAYALISALPGIPCVFYGDEAGMEGYRDPFCRMPFPWNGIDGEILSVYRELGMMRKNDPIFRDAYFRILELDSDHAVMLRYPTAESGLEYAVMFLVNNSNSQITVNLPCHGTGYSGEEYDGTAVLPPRGYLYLRTPLSFWQKDRGLL